MARSRTVPSILIVLVCAVVGASIGVYLQASRLTGRPQEFRSLGKVVTGGSFVSPPGSKAPTRDELDDFYGTIVETIESADMHRRALERVRALHPELRDGDVEIRVVRTKGSGIFNVLATGAEPRYTGIFLDALLDEYMAFRQSVLETAQGKGVQEFRQAVVNAQKHMEQALEEMEKARTKIESPTVKAEQERLTARLVSLRNQRDDLSLELKTAVEAARAPLEVKLGALEQEIQAVETATNQHDSAVTAFRTASEKFAQAKTAYEKMFEKVGDYQLSSGRGWDEVHLQERASAAAENVEDWKLPVAVGAIGGGVAGALFGLLLSFMILRAPD